MYCPKCHSSYDDGNVYCVDCGTRLISDDEDVKKTNPMERHSSRFKTPIPKNEPEVQSNSEKMPVFKSNDKMDILILQNKELIFYQVINKFICAHINTVFFSKFYYLSI